MLKKTMLAAIAAALALAALPMAATANPTLDLPENPSVTGEGGAALLETAEVGLECSSVSGEGEFTSGTTGTLTLTFHGCTETLFHFFSCNSEGQEAGTIATTELSAHLVTVEEEEESTVAALATPDESGHFASFSCSFLVNAEVFGNGLIAKVTSPGYEEPSNTAELEFASENGEQEFTTVVGDEETEYSAEVSLDGGETFEEVGLDGTGTLSFAEEGEGELTE